MFGHIRFGGLTHYIMYDVYIYMYSSMCDDDDDDDDDDVF